VAPEVVLALSARARGYAKAKRLGLGNKRRIVDRVEVKVRNLEIITHHIKEKRSHPFLEQIT
jgi:hypothetical protein